MTKKIDMRERKRQSGFTLIEVLLALSILSIIMVLVLGAMRIGVRAWEKGEDLLVAQQRSRTVLDLLARQVTSASVLMNIQNKQPLVLFEGGTRALEFTSSLPLINRMQYGPVHVRYVIEPDPGGKRRLLLFEENIMPEDYLSERQLRHDREPRVLIGHFEDLRFEYLGTKRDGSGSQPGWAASWQPEKPTDLPRAVRITFRDEKGRHDLRVIAPIYQSNRFVDAEGNNV
jgi:general secretion pathway protein J